MVPAFQTFVRSVVVPVPVTCSRTCRVVPAECVTPGTVTARSEVSVVPLTFSSVTVTAPVS
ncbi:hypothetical protein GCM10025868_14700 [Angustibacter aerolatus]|uniref:Uncharacterized protein n=1 Tax=Angustibacter aerolatus TaxID=1162965 RepID=A0ABQ6JDF7_9ACTN|nr:hypothetical protein GCM10025868_14700 [Angustibacter aerolatus]